MAKKSEPVQAINSTTKKALTKDLADMAGHATSTALYGHHGHLQGAQGERGHPMPQDSGADLQQHSFVPAAVGSRLPRRKDGGAGPPRASEYGTDSTGE
jgi:hypothetical protein